MMGSIKPQARFEILKIDDHKDYLHGNAANMVLLDRDL